MFHLAEYVWEEVWKYGCGGTTNYFPQWAVTGFGHTSAFVFYNAENDVQGRLRLEYFLLVEQEKIAVFFFKHVYIFVHDYLAFKFYYELNKRIIS